MPDEYKDSLTNEKFSKNFSDNFAYASELIALARGIIAKNGDFNLHKLLKSVANASPEELEDRVEKDFKLEEKPPQEEPIVGVQIGQ